MGKGTKKKEHAQLSTTYREHLHHVENASRSLQSVMGVLPGTRLSGGLAMPWHMPTPPELGEEEIRICVDGDAMDVDDKAKDASVRKSLVSVSTVPAATKGLDGSPINSMSASNASALAGPGNGKPAIPRRGLAPLPVPFSGPGGPLQAKPGQGTSGEGPHASAKRSLSRYLHFKQLAQQNGIRVAGGPDMDDPAQTKEANKALRLAAPSAPAASGNATLDNAREQLKRKYRDFKSPSTEARKGTTSRPRGTAVGPTCDDAAALSKRPALPGRQQPLAGPLFPLSAPANPADPFAFIQANGFRDTPPVPAALPAPAAPTPKSSLELTHKTLSPRPVFLPPGHEPRHQQRRHRRNRPSSSSLDSNGENGGPKPRNWAAGLGATLASHVNNPRVCVEATALDSCTFARADDPGWELACRPGLGVRPRLIRVALPPLRPGDPFRETPHRDWLVLELLYPPRPRRGRPPKIPREPEPSFLLLCFPVAALTQVGGPLRTVVDGGAAHVVERLGLGERGRLPLLCGQGRDGAEFVAWMDAFGRAGAALEVVYREDEVRCWV